MKTAIFQMDDNERGLPGLARVEVIKPTRTLKVAGRIIRCYRVKILEIVRPSSLPDVRRKVGQTFEAGEVRLRFER